jgi:hypothetical protein
MNEFQSRRELAQAGQSGDDAGASGDNQQDIAGAYQPWAEINPVAQNRKSCLLIDRLVPFEVRIDQSSPAMAAGM